MGWLTKLIAWCILPFDSLIEHEGIYCSKRDVVDYDWATKEAILSSLKIELLHCLVNSYSSLIFEKSEQTSKKFWKKKNKIVKILAELIEEEAKTTTDTKQEQKRLRKIKKLEQRLKRNFSEEKIKKDQSQSDQTEKSKIMEQKDPKIPQREHAIVINKRLTDLADDIYSAKDTRTSTKELPIPITASRSFLANYFNDRTSKLILEYDMSFRKNAHILFLKLDYYMLYSKNTQLVVFNNRCQHRALYHTNKVNFDAPNLVVFGGNAVATLGQFNWLIPKEAIRNEYEMHNKHPDPDPDYNKVINSFSIVYRRKLQAAQNSPSGKTNQKQYAKLQLDVRRITSEQTETTSGQNNEFINNVEQKLNNNINDNQELLADKNLEQKLDDMHAAPNMRELLQDCYVATEQIIKEQPNKNFTFQMASLGVSLGTHTILKLIHEQVIEKNNLPKIILINGMKNPAIVAASQVANYTTAPLIAIFSTPLIYFSITTVNPIFLACIGLLALMIGYIVTKKIIYSLKTKEDVRKYYTNKNSTKPEPQQYSKFRGDKISTLFAKCLEPLFKRKLNKIGWYIDTQNDFNELTKIYKKQKQINKITFVEAYHDRLFLAGSQLEFMNADLKFGDKFYYDKKEYNKSSNYYIVKKHISVPDYLLSYTYKKMCETNQDQAQNDQTELNSSGSEDIINNEPVTKLFQPTKINGQGNACEICHQKFSNQKSATFATKTTNTIMEYLK